MKPPFFIALIFCLSISNTFGQEKRVSDNNQLRQALREAGPGSTIVVEKGEYQGGLFAESLRGTAEKPVTIRAADATNRPVFRGGNSGWHLSGVSHLTIDGIVIEGARGNGLNIDDGGGKGSGSHHIMLRNIEVRDIGTMGGNLDGIKLSGLDDFQVERCRVVNWGSSGSGIDMVGCHRGEIRECFFKATGENQGTGVQAKGGSAQVAVRGCRFENAGSRAVNIGGSTGLPFFRPANAAYEAKDIEVSDSVFIGSHAPVVFVGVDGAKVSDNTIYNPGKYVVRILQESRDPRFVPCRGGIFENNLVVYDPARVSMSTNVGQGTDPKTFLFRGNAWASMAGRGRIRHEIAVTDDKTLARVAFEDEAAGDLRIKSGSQGSMAGASNAWALQGK